MQALAVCITTAANIAHHLRPNLVQKSKLIILALMNIHILSVMSGWWYGSIEAVLQASSVARIS